MGGGSLDFSFLEGNLNKLFSSCFPEVQQTGIGSKGSRSSRPMSISWKHGLSWGMSALSGRYWCVFRTQTPPPPPPKRTSEKVWEVANQDSLKTHVKTYRCCANTNLQVFIQTHKYGHIVTCIGILANTPIFTSKCLPIHLYTYTHFQEDIPILNKHMYGAYLGVYSNIPPNIYIP